MTDHPTRSKPENEHLPRDENGRFVALFCNDPDCSGVLIYEPTDCFGSKWFDWRCDGLTIARNGKLVACDRTVRGPQ